ncbi:MAG: acyltransferase domain-containing protein, partial [Proteobacteria bacterium]|nr:acyltransferase domain-containing protein [Pseudomonadota bacterium]
VALLPHTGWSVTSVLRGDDGEDVPPLDRVDVVQPALFAMGVGLAAAWRSLGLKPSAVVGHSQGEIAAAVVCGALTLEDGAKVVALRSRELVSLAGRGGMAVVELAASEVTALLEQDGDGLSVAVVNTPGSTVVSGDAVAIGAFVERMQSDGVFCRRVEVDYASHSAQVDPILASLSESLADVTGQPVSVPMFSTVTGARVEGPELDGAYWCRNLREPVRLDRALEALQAEGHGVFVEVSAHPVLAMPLTEACAETSGVVVGSLRRDEGALSTLHRTLGALHT